MISKKNIIFNIAVASMAAISFYSCNSSTDQQKMAEPTHSIQMEKFGKLPDDKEVSKYTLTNKNGMSVSIINYGGTVVSLMAPDKTGKMEDVVLGFDSLSQYETSSPYFGCLVGRFGNRIAKGKFSLDGKEYTLAVNNGVNHLHGGLKGFDKVLWNVEVPADSSSLKLSYTSPDGDEGYPGTLTMEVIYSLTDDNELKIDYMATTDKKTVVNLTHHSYFNLAGKGDILSHELKINADKFLPVDSTLIPTGEQALVDGTPFDFKNSTVIGSRINNDDQQLKFGGGYDHCWVLNGGGLRNVATLSEKNSGRIMEVFTTEPGMQFYSGNFLDGTLKGKNGNVYGHRNGLCLETQHFPDSPNKSEFPSVVLEPGQTFKSTTVYKFSVAK